MTIKPNDKYLTMLILFILFFSLTYANAQKTPVLEEKFVSIGGIEQWVSIKGEDRSKPVVLFIHGGPGSVMSPYAEAVYGSWKKDFVLVNWDQRGAGRTFGKNAPDEVSEDYWLENLLTIDLMVQDGIALTKYLIDHLGKQKVILVGTSWGSILATKMALGHPELFHMYVGHAQFVSFNKNLESAYAKVHQLAANIADTTSLQKLEALGKPPYADARHMGQFLRIVKQYEYQSASPAPEAWWKPANKYDSERDKRDRYNGDDYSFLYFAGHEKLGIKSMAANVDFTKDGLSFDIPVYLIQGEHDILTSPALNKAYFDELSAPQKEYYLLTDAAHGYNQSVVDKQRQVLQDHFDSRIHNSK
ncbi:pimeloyl-ACP methyl ester carboxylesterase [Catalinimonas alkaloidigena]|uniref:alpha/beta hydrolase n=1 Tax=Catalinimonas alkaloidigena TaxID=1075417 RepID=UPI002405CF4D|nr:alpha/beta hydrolase [Catalinimonas alkaloidigena]MDF9796592.1 pimeloyl-ACP methyl ester carboxylesterase [Catalinimonas alkaloidigena]